MENIQQSFANHQFAQDVDIGDFSAQNADSRYTQFREQKAP